MVNCHKCNFPAENSQGQGISTCSICGATQLVLDETYPLFKLEQNQYLYHGTSKKSVQSIRQHGLLPASFGFDQTNGFLSEIDFRFVGIDRTPAENHGPTKNACVVELCYSGWIIETTRPTGSWFRGIFDACKQAGADVHAIQYREDGLSVVFAATAQNITFAATNYNKMLLRTL